MKSFFIALSLFALLLFAVIGNAIYINEEIESLTEELEALGSFESPNFNDKLDEIEDNWQNFRAIADISCAYSELNKIDTTLHQLRAYAAAKSFDEYEATRTTLILLLRDLARLEKITLKSLI